MVSLAVCSSEEMKKRKRGEESVAVWFADVSYGAAAVMEEARRGEGEKRKMDDLVSGEEKRREVAVGWCDWSVQVCSRSCGVAGGNWFLVAAGGENIEIVAGVLRPTKTENNSGFGEEGRERRTTTRFGQSIEAVRVTAWSGCLPEEGRSRGLRRRNEYVTVVVEAHRQRSWRCFRWWSALWWCWSEQHNIPAEAKALSSTSASYFRRSKGVTLCTNIAFSPMQRRYFLHQHNISAEAKALLSASAQHFRRSKDIICYISTTFSPKQMRYLLHQHHIFAEAKALSSASTPYFTEEKVLLSTSAQTLPPK
ncbi:hypothetical protein HAX54_007943 [Datura stramonium]|uniref:Uncharacterized protein n=1 Tax=Datura stramonium TaxID=4076 RepID=A0ABS8TE94_DATST|nr:hypothetical protein [Datura stramonium]